MCRKSNNPSTPFKQIFATMFIRRSTMDHMQSLSKVSGGKGSITKGMHVLWDGLKKGKHGGETTCTILYHDTVCKLASPTSTFTYVRTYATGGTGYGVWDV